MPAVEWALSGWMGVFHNEFSGKYSPANVGGNLSVVSGLRTVRHGTPRESPLPFDSFIILGLAVVSVGSAVGVGRGDWVCCG